MKNIFKKIALCLVIFSLVTSACLATVTMYAPDGRTVSVEEQDVYTWKNVGWFDNISDVQETLYSLDGKSHTTWKAGVAAWKAVGWYTYNDATTTMYAGDGRTTIVWKAEVDTYTSVGWYRTKEEAVTTLYSPDGRNVTVWKSEAPSYLAVGWFTSPPAVKSEPSIKSDTPVRTTPISTIVYVTRTGAKYHRAGCRYLSKSQIPISLSDAKAQGYGACSVCNPPR